MSSHPRSEPRIRTCIASCISVRNMSAKVSMSDFDIYPRQKYVYPLATTYPHGVRITVAHTSRNATLVVKHSSPRNGRMNNLRAYICECPSSFGRKKGEKKKNKPHINASTRFIYCTKKSPIVVRLYIYNNAFIQLFFLQDRRKKKKNESLQDKLAKCSFSDRRVDDARCGWLMSTMWFCK